VHPLAEGATHAPRSRWRSRRGPRRLDYVFVRQPSAGSWRVLDAAHLSSPSEPHSDHRAVLARIGPW
jgi:endonuclease/exonuclease/phosphatase family metal-dependent hydrolase